MRYTPIPVQLKINEYMRDAKRLGLRVFYGWRKVGKVRKKEGISVIFENDRQKEERQMAFIKKMQNTVYWRFQTEDEMVGVENAIRTYSEDCILMDDKDVRGSLAKALMINSEADSRNVSKKIRDEIEEALRRAFMMDHPRYKEPYAHQLSLFE